jgi:hypothetical protein
MHDVKSTSQRNKPRIRSAVLFANKELVPRRIGSKRPNSSAAAMSSAKMKEVNKVSLKVGCAGKG